MLSFKKAQAPRVVTNYEMDSPAPIGNGRGDTRLSARKRRCIRGFVLSTALATLSASAGAFDGLVVSIADGDTLTVLHDRTPVKVRLAEIDAPEKAQPFGTVSRRALADLCFRKPASVQDLGRDRYGRTIGRVTCAGTDANAAQVAAGLAWVYDKYTKRDSPLYGLQDHARSARAGLWQHPRPVAPWEWRRAAKRERMTE